MQAFLVTATDESGATQTFVVHDETIERAVTAAEVEASTKRLSVVKVQRPENWQQTRTVTATYTAQPSTARQVLRMLSFTDDKVRVLLTDPWRTDFETARANVTQEQVSDWRAKVAQEAQVALEEAVSQAAEQAVRHLRGQYGVDTLAAPFEVKVSVDQAALSATATAVAVVPAEKAS